MSFAVNERFEGTPSMMHTSAWPWDSPDVRNLSLFTLTNYEPRRRAVPERINARFFHYTMLLKVRGKVKQNDVPGRFSRKITLDKKPPLNERGFF
jgi:hypothetical protein